jgi:hypothetical protein
MGADEATSVTRRSAIGLTGAAFALPAAPFQPIYLENRRMPFEPTFVDLVRNFTTTTGTGNFVLGAAVNGYTSFASALQTGDSFYYSAIGVEKPAEREVGRGSLLANGTISREPISGSKTNFTNGTKTISLIAAAEWFTSVQAGAGAGPAPAAVATRAVLANAPTHVPALLTESGCEGVFVFDPANHSAAVAADARKALYVPPASDPTGASGAWIRKYSGAKPATWFGAKGDGSTDDSAALQAWLDSGGDLYLPAGEYFSSAKLIVRRHILLQGAAYGFDARAVNGTSNYDNVPGSRIRFPAGVGGIDIQPQTSLTDVAAVVAGGTAGLTQEGSWGAKIRDVALIGPGTGAPATGLYARTLVYLENVHAYNFAGKGFDISGSSDLADGNSEYGTASLSTLARCMSRFNGSHGFHIRGRDANACTFENCNAQLNGGWGFLDDSMLGNTYLNCHAATNTAGSFKGSSLVGAQTYIGCYVETGTGYGCDLNSACQVIGGYLADSAINNNAASIKAQVIGSENAVINKARFVQNWATLGATTGPSYIYRHAADGLAIQGYGDSADLTLKNRNDAAVLQIPSGSLNAHFKGQVYSDGGRILLNGNSGWGGIIATQADIISQAANGLMMGGWGSTYDTTLVNKNGSVALGVLTGTANLSAAGSLAVAGAITSSGGGLGYAAGAGGTVTQATSKSTGVTLNKLSGQITMSAAALAANTTVSFTLTNSNIAATDVLVLNHASGGTGGAYNLNAQCGAGSAVVNVRNVTAGSLSEAIVIRFAVIKAVTA